MLQRIDNEAVFYAPTTAFTPPPAPSPAVTTASATLPTAVMPGQYQAWVVVNGTLSGARSLRVDPLAQGQACSIAATCVTLRCVDGVCCDTACAGTCMACDVAGHLGTCTNVPLGGEDQSPACRAADLKYCDGTGVCRTQLIDGVACTVGGQCASTFCADGRCCNNECTTTCLSCNIPGSVGACTNIPAGGLDPDATPACAAPNACDGAGVCKRVQGEDCTSNTECVSGNCVDHVCCDQACDGTCQYCNFPAPNKGTCLDVPDNEDPRSECQASSGGAPACAGKCVAHQCSYPDVGQACGVCSACDGTGRCTTTPADDPTCGTIDCSGLDTACRAYQGLTVNRCAALGVCKAANDPATCTEWTALACTDAGTPIGGDGGGASGDGGGGGGDGGSGGGGGGGCGCATAKHPGGVVVALVLLVGLTVGRRRRRYWQRRRV